MDMQALLEAMDGIALLIDRNLRVTAVGRSNWDRFWKENGGAEGRHAVVGDDVTMSFSRGVVRDTYRKLLAEVLDTKRHAIRIDYRCDAPAARASDAPVGDAGLDVCGSNAPALPVDLALDGAAAADPAVCRSDGR